MSNEAKVTTSRIEGKVAEILNKHTLVINKGRNDGVRRGDKFYIYSVLGPFKDPDTGESLGTTEKILGTVDVDILEPKFCIALAPYDTNFALIGILAATAKITRSSLPISGTDEAGGLDSTTISIGSPAFLVRKNMEVHDAIELPADVAEIPETNSSKDEDEKED